MRTRRRREFTVGVNGRLRYIRKSWLGSSCPLKKTESRFSATQPTPREPLPQTQTAHIDEALCAWDHLSCVQSDLAVV